MMRLIVAAVALTTGSAGAAMVLTTGSAFVPSTAQLAARRPSPTPRARALVAKMVDIDFGPWLGGRGALSRLFDLDGSLYEETMRKYEVCSNPLRPVDLCGRPLRCTAFASPPCAPSPVAPPPPCSIASLHSSPTPPYSSPIASL